MGKKTDISQEEVLAALAGKPLGEKIDHLLTLVYQIIRMQDFIMNEIRNTQERVNTHQHQPVIQQTWQQTTGTDWGVYGQSK